MNEGLSAIEERIYQLAKPYLATRENDAHTQRALDFALRLLKTEKGDRSIVVPAIILHDVGWSQLQEDVMLKAWGPEKDESLTVIHEKEGAKIAAGILRQVGYDSSKVNEILQIIDGHDTRQDAISLNDEIVKDADKLTRYSKSFWFIVESFGYAPLEFYERLKAFSEEWFFLPVSREIAGEELRQRRREIEEGSPA